MLIGHVIGLYLISITICSNVYAIHALVIIWSFVTINTCMYFSDFTEEWKGRRRGRSGKGREEGGGVGRGGEE